MPQTEPCPQCGFQLETEALSPYSEMECGGCQAKVRVRSVFDHFRITRELGVGGMSLVFEAQDLALQRPVALKILNAECLADAARLAQFER
jgi:hypothetical protein